MPSLSAKTYEYRVRDAYLNDKPQMMLDAFDEYQRSHCYDPQLVHLVSSHDLIPVLREVDCGRCYHCRETKINSWVTRSYAHCEYFKNVYFITLTYRPFYTSSSLSNLIINKLGHAVWIWDHANQNKRYCYNPCLLVKKHYQDFLKRLRKNTGFNDISYIVSGEYGHDYGRPHFHFILFSNHHISYADICKAWSFKVYKDEFDEYHFYKNNRKFIPFDYLIGKVDYNDLVTNGSFNDKDILVDGKNLNARNCFAYVCKYVCKGNDFNTKRLVLAFNNLFHDYSENMNMEQFHDFCIDISKKSNLYDSIKNLRINNNLKYLTNSFIYETKSFCPSEDVLCDCSQFYRKNQFTQENEVIFPKNLQDFCNLFRQFVEVSRGCPIGSLYAEDHMDEFVQGKFSKPKLQNNGYVLPSYFRRKTEEYVYGLRQVHKTISSISYVFGALPLLKEHFESVLSGKDKFAFILHESLNSSLDCIIKKSHKIFIDVSTSERIFFPFDEEIGCAYAQYVRYDRKSRRYVYSGRSTIKAFITKYLPRLNESIRRFDVAKNEGILNAKLCKDASILLDEYGYTLKNLRQRFADKQDRYIKFRDTTYHASHFSVE